MSYFCTCGTKMDYDVPRDECCPPMLICPGCGNRVSACGEDPAYTSSTVHVYLVKDKYGITRESRVAPNCSGCHYDDDCPLDHANGNDVKTGKTYSNYRGQRRRTTLYTGCLHRWEPK